MADQSLSDARCFDSWAPAWWLSLANFGWNDLIKPWCDVWLPESTIEQHVNDILPTLTPIDVGPLGFMLLFPMHRSGFTRPFFRMPEPDGHPFVWLFDVLTASPPGPPPPPNYVADMLARNRRWFEDARAGWHAVSDQRD